MFDIALQYANPEELDPNDRMVYHPMEPLDVDVKVELPNRSPNSEECLPLYLDFDALVAVCQAADLLCVRPLARGRLCEVQDFQLGFESTWPRRLGLPPLPNSGANVAEGVVLRPVQPIYAANRAERPWSHFLFNLLGLLGHMVRCAHPAEAQGAAVC